jgi:hypothetical protein
VIGHKIYTVDTDASHLCYLCQTLAWMGGDVSWSADMLAEQLGEFDDPRIHRDMAEADRAGLVAQDQGGYRLTEAGWAVAAGER